MNSMGDPFYASPFSQFYRRHTPYMGQPDYRIYELNKRLQQRTEVSEVHKTTFYFSVCLCCGSKYSTLYCVPNTFTFTLCVVHAVTCLHDILKYALQERRRDIDKMNPF